MKRLFIRIAVLFIVLAALLLTGVILLTAAIIRDERNALPVPDAWKQTKQIGSVSSICLGGPEDCGTQTRRYTTTVSKERAYEELQQSMRLGGWKLELIAQTEKRLTANAIPVRAKSNESATLELYDNEVVLQYKRRY